MQLRSCLVQNAKKALDCHHGWNSDPFTDEENCVFSAGAAYDELINVGSSPGMPSEDIYRPHTPNLACRDTFPVICNATVPFRTITGICNHPSEVLWGVAGSKLRRFVGSAYADGHAAPRGGAGSALGHCIAGGGAGPGGWRCRGVAASLLPNPRMVAQTIRQRFQPSNQPISVFFIYFAMLVHYDISLIPEEKGRDCCNSRGSSCFEIHVPCGDPVFPAGTKSEPSYRKKAVSITEFESPGIFNFHRGQKRSFNRALNTSKGHIKNRAKRDNRMTLKMQRSCFDFKRSIAFCREFTVSREQVNAQTAFVDLSFIYGSDFYSARRVRLNHMGLLRTSNWGRNLPELKDGRSFSGDPRVSTAPGLQALATLFIREHNRLAGELSGMCCQGDNGKLYQLARKIVVAEFQNFVFAEYLPQLLGRTEWGRHGLDLSTPFSHDPRANPTVRSAFAAAVSRFGHLLIPSQMKVRNYRGKEKVHRLVDVLLDEKLHKIGAGRGVDYILNGMLNEGTINPGGDNGGSVDGPLFVDADGTWTTADLLARDIQRGRDHGLPSYNSYR